MIAEAASFNYSNYYSKPQRKTNIIFNINKKKRVIKDII